MRRFVVVGQAAKASPDFLLVDIPSTSGRLDVLLRALRAALLYSHGVRKDSVAYLLLLGLPERARTLRIEGAASRYLRPDERSLATTMKKLLVHACAGTEFEAVRAGMAVAEGGIETLLPELSGNKLYLLEPGASDIRELALSDEDQTFVLGDHLGLRDGVREQLLAAGAVPVSVGPRPLHTEDVIALVHNELDRREHARLLLAPPLGGEKPEHM
jgi:tRNA (pseudouridine54-N1)-methyltransferase